MTILGPEVGLSDLLDYEITEKLKAEAEKKKKIFHPLRPSSAGHCSRKLALELQEYRGKASYNKPLIEPNIDRLFQLGHAVEYSVLKQFELVKILPQRYKQQVVSLFTIQTSNGPELIEGSLDVCFWNEKHKIIADVKSKKDGWSSFFKSKWDETLDKLSNFPSIQKISETSFYAEDLSALLTDLNQDWMCDNLYQLNLYAMSSFMQERAVEVASLIYYNKNDSRIFELRFKPSKEIFEQIEIKYQDITLAVDQDQVDRMVCEFFPGTIRHAFCDCHKIKSYSDADPIKEFFKSLPKKVWAKKAEELGSDELIELYEIYKVGVSAQKEAEKAELKLIELLLGKQVSKVQFDDGLVYEVKLYKSPKEHYELKRSK